MRFGFIGAKRNRNTNDASFVQPSDNSLQDLDKKRYGFITPTRLIVRDAKLLDEVEVTDELGNVKRLKWQDIETDLPYTEVKVEVALDNITAASNPRQMERVPAGALFGGDDLLLFSVFSKLERQGLRTAQIRRVFGEVKRLTMRWEPISLRMLRPKSVSISCHLRLFTFPCSSVTSPSSSTLASRTIKRVWGDEAIAFLSRS